MGAVCLWLAARKVAFSELVEALARFDLRYLVPLVLISLAIQVFRALRWKIELIRQLYARGYEREDIYELFRFIDWLLVLPEELTKSFRERVEEINQESKMKYVTSIERLARKEGREEGLEEGLVTGMRLTALTLFEEKFGPPDASIRSRVEKAGREQILLWMKRAVTASSLDEVLAT